MQAIVLPLLAALALLALPAAAERSDREKEIVVGAVAFASQPTKPVSDNPPASVTSVPNQINTFHACF